MLKQILIIKVIPRFDFILFYLFHSSSIKSIKSLVCSRKKNAIPVKERNK